MSLLEKWTPRGTDGYSEIDQCKPVRVHRRTCHSDNERNWVTTRIIRVMDGYHQVKVGSGLGPV